jgi:hypothetical protein
MPCQEGCKTNFKLDDGELSLQMLGASSQIHFLQDLSVGCICCAILVHFISKPHFYTSIVFPCHFFDSFWFMQAMLAKHAFGRSSSEDTKMLQGHNQTLALPSHRIQELLTAQALITALMLADKHCQDIPRFSRWIAAEEALMRNMGHNTEAGLNLPKRLLRTHLDLQWWPPADPVSTADTPLLPVLKSLPRAMTLNSAVSSQDNKPWASSTVKDGIPEPAQGWASKLESNQSWDPQTDHAPPANYSNNGNNFQETSPYSLDQAYNRGFSWRAPEAHIESSGSVIACTISAIPKMRTAKTLDISGFLRQSPTADAEVIHQGATSEAHVRDPSFGGTRKDAFCGNKDGVHVASGHFTESAVPYLDHCSSDGNSTLGEVPDCSTCDESVDESAMENGSTVLWTRRRLRFSQATDIRNLKSMNDDIEQVARNAMLSFGIPAVQVQLLCMA